MTDYAEADGSNRWPKERACGSVEHQASENHRKVRPNSNNECGDSNHDGAERCQSPLRADCIQQLATRHEGKQAGETAQARTRWRGFSSMGQRHNECHLLTVLSNQTREPRPAATPISGYNTICDRT